MTALLTASAVVILAIWSLCEGAERDLFDLLDDPAPTWVPARCVWISARVVAALMLTVATISYLLGGAA